MTYDPIELAAMRGSGWTVPEIAAELGVTRSTVYRYLGEIGLNQLPVTDECNAGHSLLDDDVIERYDGRRECRKCKQARDRAYQKRRYWAQRA